MSKSKSKSKAKALVGRVCVGQFGVHASRGSRDKGGPVKLERVDRSTCQATCIRLIIRSSGGERASRGDR